MPILAYNSEAVAKLAWVDATTQTVRLYGKEEQHPHGNFATASKTLLACRLCEYGNHYAFLPLVDYRLLEIIQNAGAFSRLLLRKLMLQHGLA